MKKASFIASLILLFTSAVVAQTPTPATSPGATQTGTAVTSLTGCLAGPTNGTYTLRTLTDNTTYTLRSDNPLATHANHAITVTGSLEGSTPGTAAGTATGATNPGNTPSSANPSSTNPSSANPSSANPSSTNPSRPDPNSTATVAIASAAPVFRVTSVAIANESCEAGSAAVGTGLPTTSTMGTTQASGGQTTSSQSTTTAPNTTTGQAGVSVTGQTGTSVTGQAGTSANSTVATGPAVSGTQAGDSTATQTITAAAQGASLTGCLMASTRDPGRYFIRTTQGKKFVTEVIPSTDLAANMADHVGHRVRITGQFSDTLAANSTTDSAVSNPNHDLPQSDQPDKGKKAHEQDRNTGRQFTASNLEMISTSGCPQSGTTPNKVKAKKPASKQ